MGSTKVLQVALGRSESDEVRNIQLPSWACSGSLLGLNTGWYLTSTYYWFHSLHLLTLITPIHSL